DEGVRILEQAAAGNEPEALCMLATLRAAGAWTHQSWPEALDLLERAANGGATDARTQLCLLSADQNLAEAAQRSPTRAGIWRDLKNSIDLRAAITPPPPVQIL